jgi:1-acyl-sn-glycerol-3-phosphate acyltransferase
MQTFIIMTCLVVSLGWFSIITGIVYAIDRRLCSLMYPAIAKKASRRIFALFGTYMDFQFAGDRNLTDELPGQYLVFSNHQSLLDIPLYMRFLDASRLRFVAKAELGNHIPLISPMLKSTCHCLVNRKGSPGKVMKEIDVFAVRVIENGWIPVIFPEGTRSLDGNLGTFHAAGFRRFLDRAPMPVVVCAIDGGWRMSSLLGMAKNMKGGSYRIRILRIFPAPTGKAEQVRILEEGRLLIQAQLDEWRSAEIQC